MNLYALFQTIAVVSASALLGLVASLLYRARDDKARGPKYSLDRDHPEMIVSILK